MAKKKSGPKGAMTVAEAGKKGGTTTRDRYADQGFYQKVGSMGGQTTAERHSGDGFYQRIGKLGGGRVRDLIRKAKAAEAQE